MNLVLIVLIKYYQLMKKNQSSIDTNISTFYFAVIPLQLSFNKNYDNKFTLYFEKSLQIISKFQALPPNSSNSLKVVFGKPNNIQHFRIQSQKNLQYQWSLYMHHSGEGQQNEEFIEGQKVSLKDSWTRFSSKKDNTCLLQIEFNTIKCKLTYIVLAGGSSLGLHQVAEKYFSNGKNATPQEQVNVSNVSPRELTVISNISPKKVKGQEVTKQIKGGKGTEGVQSKQQIVFASQKVLEEVSVLKEQSKKKEQEKPAIVQGQAQRESYQLKVPSGVCDSPQHKLSLSELQIGLAIQKDVNHYEANKQVQEQVIPADPAQEPKREITLTQSQLLNQKRQAIVPIYKNKKFILAAIVIILLIGGLFFMSFGSKKSNKAKQGKQKLVKSKQQKKGKGKR